MSNSPSLEQFEDAFSDINKLETILGNLDTDLSSFNQLTSEIEKVSSPFPININNDLNIFYSGLKEVETMIEYLNKIRLKKLQDILVKSDTGIQDLIQPIPKIIADLKSISTQFPAIQQEIATITKSSKGLDGSIKSFKAKLKSWSNTNPRSTHKQTGTGKLNAVYYEMLVAIKDNKILKNKYDKEVNQIAGQLNTLGSKLDQPVSKLNASCSDFDAQIKSLNTYLTNYYNSLLPISELSDKVDKVVAMLDIFKPAVDLIFGILQPLGWFIKLIEAKTCSLTTEILGSDGEPSVEIRFLEFEESIYSYFKDNNIGQKIQAAVGNISLINDLKSATNDLHHTLTALSADKSISTIQSNIKSINGLIDQVEKELKTLSTTAQKAKGSVQFARTKEGNKIIFLKGTYIQDAKTKLIYVTTEKAIFNTSDLTSNKVKCQAFAVGKSANVRANSIGIFSSTLVKQSNGKFIREAAPVYDDNFTVSNSSAFRGGTDMSIGQVQTEANDLANKMLPILMRLKK